LFVGTVFEPTPAAVQAIKPILLLSLSVFCLFFA
jgi:hypothetical protein